MDGELPYAVKVVKAQILHRIKGTEASIESFNELSHSNPGDLGVRADFAAMLMETKRDAWSEKLLEFNDNE